MLKRKYIIVTFIITVATFKSLAQKSSLFAKGGINLATVTKEKNIIRETNNLASFHAGLMANISFCKLVSFQPALFFTGKGAKIRAGDGSGISGYTARTRPYYIELPVNVVLNLPVKNKETVFFIGGGGYAAAGVAGRNKAEVNLIGERFSINTDIKYGKRSPNDPAHWAGIPVMNWFDYGLNATAGAVFNKYLISLNYSHGLKDINRGIGSSDDNNMHRIFSISLGYQLR